MAEAKSDQRTCGRFRVPGATAGYKILSSLIPRKGFDEELCPVLDLSRGGLCLLAQKPVKVKQRIYLDVVIPGEPAPLSLYGAVRWLRFNSGQIFKYQVGIQLNPYGDKKEQNSPLTLIKLTALEEEYLARKAAIPPSPKT
jgi:hypothetical protein